MLQAQWKGVNRYFLTAWPSEKKRGEQFWWRRHDGEPDKLITTKA